MPTYTVKDPKTGQTISLTGDSPPTEAELEEVFAKVAAQRPEMTYAIVNGKRVPLGGDEADIAPPQTALEQLQQSGGAQDLRNLAGGVRAGIAKTVFRGGDLIRQGYNAIAPESMQVERVINRPEVQAGMTAPEGWAGAIGKGAEQAGEFAVAGGPVSAVTKGAPLIARMGAEAVLGGGMSAYQGDSPTVGAVLGAAGPVVGAGATWAGQKIKDTAIPLVRAGLKTPLTVLKQAAGASRTGLDFQAIKIAKFIVDNRIANPSDALKIVKDSESEIQALMASHGSTMTDAPQRAVDYLNILEKRARKSLSPDRADAFLQAAKDVKNGPLGQTIITTNVIPGTAIGGQAPTTITTKTQALRPGVPADEALESARITGEGETKRQWGELKGAAVEAIKTQERAVRDAVKQVLPAVRTPLQQQGQALIVRQVMDRALIREGNRDVASLPGLIGLQANAVIGAAAHFLRNNQRRVGIWADQLGKAIQSNDAATAAAILHRLGVGMATQGTGDTELPPDR